MRDPFIIFRGLWLVLVWLMTAIFGVLRIVFDAHLTVIYNFQPRRRVLYELDRTRTSYTKRH